jgi:hypothetical protein
VLQPLCKYLLNKISRLIVSTFVIMLLLLLVNYFITLFRTLALSEG